MYQELRTSTDLFGEYSLIHNTTQLRKDLDFQSHLCETKDCLVMYHLMFFSFLRSLSPFSVALTALGSHNQ